MAKATTTKRAAKAAPTTSANNKGLAQRASKVAATATGIEAARANVANKAASGVGVTLHSTGAPIAGLAAMPQLAKPTRHMCQVWHPGKHPGIAACIKRWHLYKAGDTLLSAKCTLGQTPNDLTFWAKMGYGTLTPATDAQYNAACEAWAKAQGKVVAVKAAPAKAPTKAAPRKAAAKRKAKATA